MENYPLQWPSGFPRTQIKCYSKFSTTLSAALKNVEKSLQAFSKDSGKRITEIVISSNVTLGSQNPKESGVAIWFMWDNLHLCIAVDRYYKVEENLQAIHHIVEARRTELRHGGLHIVRQTFLGFKGLPEHGSNLNWWDVLGVSKIAIEKEIRDAYLDKCKKHHPDKGGSTEAFAMINKAYEQSKTINP